MRRWLRRRLVTRRLRLRPGDVVVVQSEERLTLEMVDRLRSELAELFPDNRAVIFDQHLRVSVERHADGLTTADHLAAVAHAIQRAGGPERVRFAPVAVELLGQVAGEANAEGPVLFWCEGRDDVLVDLVVKRLDAPVERLTRPPAPSNPGKPTR